MNGYELPTSLNVGGVDYSIRTDFRSVLDILIAMNDPDLDLNCKIIVLIKIMYPDYKEIPAEHILEAYEKACDFIDCGQKDDGKKHPRTVDWEQDAGIIIPAVNGVAHVEVRALSYLHWWTFFGYFMEIRESLFTSVLNIRQKKARGKRLEKWERDFYKENKDIIDFERKDSDEVKKEKDSIAKWL